MSAALGELPFAAEEVAASAPAPDSPPPATQYLSFNCDRCGRRVGRNASHYLVMICVCGKEYWALQPKRGGPLAIFPWPGTFLQRPTL